MYYAYEGAGRFDPANAVMARELFIPHRFNQRSRATLDQANAIIEEYQEQGFELTLRQLFYQFVARDLLANTRKN